VPSVNTNFSNPVSTVWLEGPSMITLLPSYVTIASISLNSNVMVSLPPSALMRSLPWSAVNASSPSVPANSDCTLMVIWSVSTCAVDVPVPLSSVYIVSVSAPK